MNRGLLVKQVRFAYNSTQKAFGKMLGVTLDEVSKWERGVRSVPDARVFQLLYYYEMETGNRELFKNIIWEIEHD